MVAKQWSVFEQAPLGQTGTIKQISGHRCLCKSMILLATNFLRSTGGKLAALNEYGCCYATTGRSSRDDDKTVLNELVPTLLCLNSSSAGASLF